MRSIVPLLVLISFQIINCNGGHFVQVVSNLQSHQRIYSSTLQWTEKRKGEDIPQYAVMGAETLASEDKEDQPQGKAYVCRLQNEGVWLYGQVRTSGKDSGMCVASQHGSIYKKVIFHILENVDDGGRISWVKWDKFKQIPSGTVTSDDNTYVARRATKHSNDNYSHELGKYEHVGFGKIFVITDDGEKNFEDGELLVETEPIKYQMKRVKFNKFKKSEKKFSKILGKKILTNEDAPTESISRVDSVIDFK